MPFFMVRGVLKSLPTPVLAILMVGIDSDFKDINGAGLPTLVVAVLQDNSSILFRCKTRENKKKNNEVI